MTGFRTSQNQPLALPFEGMDLQTPLPLMPPTRAPFIGNFFLDGQTLKVRNGSSVLSYISGLPVGNIACPIMNNSNQSANRNLHHH